MLGFSGYPKPYLAVGQLLNAGTVNRGGWVQLFIYTSFDKPSRITKGDHQIDFAYGADRARWKRVDTDTAANNVTTTYYLGGIEKVVSGSGTRFKRTIGGVAIWTHDGNGALLKRQTLFKDALGSVVALRDSATGVLSPTAFNPWGERVLAGNFNDVLDGSQLTPYLDLFGTSTTRGFTGHEMLDAVGVIHMNGRIYDPRLGRFLQADSFVDGVTDTQGYNRYSYVGNNPLSYTDPTGHFKLKEAAGFILAVVVSVACYGACIPSVWAAWGAAAGFVGGYIATGTAEGAFSGALSGAITGYLGGAFFNAGTIGFESYVGWSALGGGVTSLIGGGKFGHGFVAAGTGALAGRINLGSTQGPVAALARTFVRSVIGGTISQATGGKFANGAAYAAFASIVAEAASYYSENPYPGESYTDFMYRTRGVEVVAYEDVSYWSGRIVIRTAPTMSDVTNFAAGFGDSASFGYTRATRAVLDIGSVDTTSDAYQAGSDLETYSGYVTGAKGLTSAGKTIMKGRAWRSNSVTSRATRSRIIQSGVNEAKGVLSDMGKGLTAGELNDYLFNKTIEDY